MLACSFAFAFGIALGVPYGLDIAPVFFVFLVGWLLLWVCLMAHLLDAIYDCQIDVRICLVPSRVKHQVPLWFDRGHVHHVCPLGIVRLRQPADSRVLASHILFPLLDEKPNVFDLGFKVSLISLRLAWADAGWNPWATLLHDSSPFLPGLLSTMEYVSVPLPVLMKRLVWRCCAKLGDSTSLLVSGMIVGAFASHASARLRRGLNRSPLAPASNCIDDTIC